MDFMDDEEQAGITEINCWDLFPETTLILSLSSLIKLQPHILDHPLLTVDLYDGSGHEFRAIPSQIQTTENNLSIADMDFDEFAESGDESVVFRGFPES